MKASIAIAQFPITWDIQQNLAAITSLLANVQPDEIVVLPEGALSGYDTDLSALRRLQPLALAHAMDRLAELAQRRAIHLFCGTLLFEHGAWSNAALYFSPDGTRWTYRKINLAMNERGQLDAGSELSTLPIHLASGPITLGVQICREIRFPEQWQHLADRGAQAFIYLTHAANPSEPAGVWRSHLISRAAENQRFVLAANVADPHQHCPSMVISPRGEVLAEVRSGQTTVIRNQNHHRPRRVGQLVPRPAPTGPTEVELSSTDKQIATGRLENPCGQAFRESQYPTPPLHLQPDAHKAVLGAWERLDVPLAVAA